MKFTFTWLKEHLKTSASLEEVIERLNQIGLLVDSCTQPGESLRGFKIAEVVKVQPHPSADRLKVCQVNTGLDVIQVVCGAPNVKEGMKGVLAVPGLTIPTSGLIIRNSKIRDVESAGMMCSERELGLGDAHEGIIELPMEAPVGEEFSVYKGLNDPIIDLEITPNRGDCLGVIGIARDLAATGIGELIPLRVSKVKGSFSSPIQVSIQDLEGCPFFTGRLIRNVKNGPSPEWLQTRLKAIGLKPISALVDITNFIAYDRGRPLHVFDADKLRGSLIIRKAKEGEQLRALNNNLYDISPEAVVIEDEEKLCSLAGIIGGLDSGCSEETTHVFLESALFDPVRIATTGRSLGILSDARYRFERGVDSSIIEEGLEQASQMILEMCGGEAGEVVRAGADPTQHRLINFRASRVWSLGGLEIEEKQAYEILEKLGFHREKETLFKVPSWRPDIKGEADLVEEVLRIHGYDSIKAVELPKLTIEAPITEMNSSWGKSWRIKRQLVARGMSESYTWSFLKKEWAKKFGGGHSLLTIQNPISNDMSDMRPSLLPLLLEALQRNIARGYKDLALFELGNQYQVEGEVLMASGVRGEVTGSRHWLTPPREVDLFDAKADVYAVLGSCGLEASSLPIIREAPEWYHPGRSGKLMLGAQTPLAYFGELHPSILEVFEIEGPVVAFEVFIEVIPNLKKAKKNAPAFSPYQAVERDFCFILDNAVQADKLVQLVQKIDKSLIKAVSIFDVYEGKGIPQGKKSIALSIRLEPEEHTLTEAEITSLSSKIIEEAQKKLGAELRS
jgi:phenylalanyl-tRNA synthetase beta chain